MIGEVRDGSAHLRISCGAFRCANAGLGTIGQHRWGHRKGQEQEVEILNLVWQLAVEAVR